MTVLITGASKGIGKELALEFAKHGHDLALVARSENLLEELKDRLEKQYSIKVSIYLCDLTNDAERKSFLKFFNQEIEILINNAGYGDYSFFPSSDIDKNLTMIDLNIKALVELSHHFTNIFLKENNPNKKYKILNIASTAAFCPGPNMATYFASKAFVLSFSRALYSELKDQGIHVSCLCPGPTHSDFAQNANIENALAFKLGMNSKEVARIAYQELFKDKAISVVGATNKFLVFIRRFLPTELVASINKALLKTKPKH